MTESDILFRGKIFSLYSQVALFDAEFKDAYPLWKAGQETIVFGPRGAAVVVRGDQQVDVVVSIGKEFPQNYALCVSGEILIGNRGVFIGNVPAADVSQIQIKSGRYAVSIFTDGIGVNASNVYFFLDSIMK